MIRGLIACATLLVAGMAFPAQAEFKPIEMSIPFIRYGAIKNWHAQDTNTLYVQDRQNNWYRAELFNRCRDLPFADAIGFDAGPTDRLDRNSSLIVRGQDCPLKSLVASGPPLPKKVKRQLG